MLFVISRAAASALGIVAALSVAGCATTTTTDSASSAGVTETAAMAATFRYLFTNNASALKANAASYCV